MNDDLYLTNLDRSNQEPLEAPELLAWLIDQALASPTARVAYAARCASEMSAAILSAMAALDSKGGYAHIDYSTNVLHLRSGGSIEFLSLQNPLRFIGLPFTALVVCSIETLPPSLKACAEMVLLPRCAGAYTRHHTQLAAE